MENIFLTPKGAERFEKDPVCESTRKEEKGKFTKEKQMYFTGVQVNMKNILIKNAVFQ